MLAMEQSGYGDCVKEYFPECRQVLDYCHCSEHLFDFAKIHFNNRDKANEWIEQTKIRLFHNNANHVISGLKRMKCQTGEAQNSRDKLVNYLSNHKERIEYGRLRRGGYPLGSGAIESSNKFISNIRLKRSGACWKVDYANNILKLRCAKYNSNPISTVLFIPDSTEEYVAILPITKLHEFYLLGYSHPEGTNFDIA